MTDPAARRRRASPSGGPPPDAPDATHLQIIQRVDRMEARFDGRLDRVENHFGARLDAFVAAFEESRTAQLVAADKAAIDRREMRDAIGDMSDKIQVLASRPIVEAAALAPPPEPADWKGKLAAMAIKNAPLIAGVVFGAVLGALGVTLVVWLGPAHITDIVKDATP